MSFTVFSDMLGLLMTEVSTDSEKEEMLFLSESGRRFRFYHGQDCCETVKMEEIIGDLNDLIGAPILLAEEVSNEDAPICSESESYTWTFYKFATIKGSVTVRWFGESNGYYSESVSYEEITPEPFPNEEKAPVTERLGKNQNPIDPFEKGQYGKGGPGSHDYFSFMD